jgi:hypothetical protein
MLHAEIARKGELYTQNLSAVLFAILGTPEKKRFAIRRGKHKKIQHLQTPTGK